MAIRGHVPGYWWLRVSHNAAMRTGVSVGVCLTLVFSVWLIVANHVPFLERFALERNIGAAALLILFGLVPIFRFLRMPGDLLASSLIAWLIFSLCYRALSWIFHGLNNRLSTFQVFMLGAVVYLIVTTLSWIGTFIWKAREAHVSHPNHHAS